MEMKEFEALFGKMDTELKQFIQKAEGEIKASGKVSEETRIAVEKLAKTAKDLEERVIGVEQKSIKQPASGPEEKSFGQQFIESDNYKSLKAGSSRSGKVNVGSFWKAALVNATGLNQPLVPAFMRPGIVTPAMQRLVVRDLFPNVPIATNLVMYTEETGFTNAAAPQGTGTSPQVYENTPKPESAMAFTLRNAPAATIAHWIPVSNQLLDDAPALQGYIDARLRYGLKLVEEGQLLNGDGTGANLAGLITKATARDVTRDAGGDTKNDTVRRAITQADLSFYPSDWVIINPVDWEAIELIKTTGTASSGQYVATDPTAANVKRRWGKVIVDTPSMPAGHFLTGSSMAATIWDRQDATVEISREHSDFFIRNMSAVLAEERLILTVEIPKALIYGAFIS